MIMELIIMFAVGIIGLLFGIKYVRKTESHTMTFTSDNPDHKLNEVIHIPYLWGKWIITGIYHDKTIRRWVLTIKEV